MHGDQRLNASSDWVGFILCWFVATKLKYFSAPIDTSKINESNQGKSKQTRYLFYMTIHVLLDIKYL